jgi:SAM-dependent methyltransferase
MSGFSVEWLARREPYDRRARNATVLDAMVRAFSGWPSLSVVDLGCGTGSTLRAISAQLSPRQNWRLVDNSLSLLARAAMLSRPPALNVTATPVDLARDLEAALDGPVDLVTTSALLDLVSEDWLGRLVVEAAARRLPVYAALSYDGRMTFDPVDELDRRITHAVNTHQRTDKGFGPALGPDAAEQAIVRFHQVGYTVVQGLSDWEFGADDEAIQSDVLLGWAAAAEDLGRQGRGELSPDQIAGWLARRRNLVKLRRSRIRVGHVDLFASPTTK